MGINRSGLFEEGSNVEKLIQLGTLYHLINNCKVIVQSEGVAGGHRGVVDQLLKDAQNEVYDELERLKEEMENGN